MATQGIRLNPDIQTRLKMLGGIRKRSMNYLIQEAVTRYIDIEENFETEKLEDEARLQHFLDTGEYVTHEKMKAKLRRFIKKVDKLSETSGA